MWVHGGSRGINKRSKWRATGRKTAKARALLPASAATARESGLVLSFGNSTGKSNRAAVSTALPRLRGENSQSSRPKARRRLVGHFLLFGISAGITP